MAFTRRPAVAGMFYPGDPGVLQHMVDGFLNEAGVTPAPEAAVAIMAPHAGYVYSGATAAFAFKRVQEKKPKRVLLLGTSHRFRIDTASVFMEGAFQTPLGTFPVDSDFAEAVGHELASVGDEPHMQEHALEVQLPFLARAIGCVPIVPVLFGGQGTDWHVRAGEHLAKMVDGSDLVVASTDLSHYLREDQAEAIDHESLDAVLQQDCRNFNDGIASGCYSMCGSSAVVATMAFAINRKASDWKLLDYRTSAEASGDTSRVVGYGAISMERR